MGVEYLLIKPHNGETYELGKAAMRQPEPDWERLIKNLHPVKDQQARMKILSPSEASMWNIGSENGNCQLTRLPDRWTKDSLAETINIAVFNEDNMAKAMDIASDILSWAGNDQVVLIPDNLDTDEILDRFGFKMQKMKKTGSIYKA